MPLPQFPKSRAATLKAVHRYERLLHSLRLHLNTFSSVNTRLPPEIFSDILLRLVEDHIQTSKHSYGWLRYTHVCKHWRTIALQCAPLWSFIIQPTTTRGRGAVVRRMLSLSRQSPLTVVLKRQAFGRWLESSIGELQRIRSLTMVADLSRSERLALPPGRRARNPEVTVIPLQNAPFLRTLTILGPIKWVPTIGYAQLPSLRELSFHRFSFQTSAYLLQPTLTHLFLSNWGREESPITLLEALRGLPLLQSLSLSNDWHPLVVPADAWFSVKLPHLCAWEIETELSGPWTRLLKQLICARIVRTRLSFSSIAMDMISFLSTRLVENFESNTISLRTPPSVASLVIHDVTDLVKCIVQIWHGTSGVDNPSYLHEPPVFSLTFSSRDVAPSRYLLHQSIGSENVAVRILHLSSSLALESAAEWADLFQAMKQVETLYVDHMVFGTGQLSLAPAQRIDNDYPPNLGDPQSDFIIPFPKLRTLVHRCSGSRGPNEDHKPPASYWEPLQASLLVRMQHGCPVDNVLLLVDDGRRFSADTLDGFKKVVTGAVIEHDLNGLQVQRGWTHSRWASTLLEVLRCYDL